MKITGLNVSVYYEHPNKNELAKLANFEVQKEIGETYFVEGKKGKRIYKAQGKLIEGSVDWFTKHENPEFDAQDFVNGFFVRLHDKVKVTYDDKKELVSIIAYSCQIGTFPTPATNL